MQLTLCQAIAGSAEAPGIQYQLAYLKDTPHSLKLRAYGTREENKIDR